jgi:Asp/Glu/hydantoin racemase
MRMIIIPPYSNANINQTVWEQDLLYQFKSKGQLEGIDVEIAEGPPTEHNASTRDAEFSTLISVGVIRRVKEYGQMGKYDAIVVGGAYEPGFYATQMNSPIPIVYTLHSAVHIASFIGERFSVIQPTDPGCQLVRRCVQNHGLGHKLASVRAFGYNSTSLSKFTQSYDRKERTKTPEGEKIVDAIATQCIAAIEKERADSIVFEIPLLQLLEDEIKQKLAHAGYGEIKIICGHLAAISLARALVSMNLCSAPRAYATDALKAKPEYR